jgi:hypothetical protein
VKTHKIDRHKINIKKSAESAAWQGRYFRPVQSLSMFYAWRSRCLMYCVRRFQTYERLNVVDMEIHNIMLLARCQRASHRQHHLSKNHFHKADIRCRADIIFMSAVIFRCHKSLISDMKMLEFFILTNGIIRYLVESKKIRRPCSAFRCSRPPLSLLRRFLSGGLYKHI